MDVEEGATRRRTATGSSLDEETQYLVTRDVIAGTPDSHDSETTDIEEEPGSYLINEEIQINTSVANNKKMPWKAKYCNGRYKKLALFVFVLIMGAILVVMVATTFAIYDEMPEKSCFDVINEREYAPFIFTASEGKFSLCHNGRSLLSGTLGKSHSYIKQTTVKEYSYSKDTLLTLSRHNVSEDHCVRIDWSGPASVDLPLIDCFDITNDSLWFGGYEVYNQLWPINSDVREMTPFLPRDFLVSDDSFGPILHPVWYTTDGVVIFVDEDIPLHVSINDPTTQRNGSTSSQICLQALSYALNCFPHSSNITNLSYTVCGFENISRAAQFFLSESNAIDHPVSSPSLDLFRKPMWSTSNAFETDTSITYDKLKEYASNITTNGYSISQLIIEDGYSISYGDLSFDPNKFPNSTGMVSTLNSLGIPNVSAKVTPFIETVVANFYQMGEMGRLLPGANSVDGNSISLIRWWKGYGAVINFADNDTIEWQSDRLAVFVSNYSLSGLKFDAGDESYIPRCVYIENLTHPTQFTKMYVQFVGQQPYRANSEVRVGYFNQREPILFRILDFRSVWGLDHGLHSVITTVLSLGLAGYPFILPDTIGGGSLDPSPELYVRWVQLSAFLPVMQFSYPPWRYNSTITAHVQQMIQLHEEIATNYTMHLIEEAIHTGFPIIRPLWWIAPNDNNATSVNDQFLIGNSVLVAPIISPYSTRTVYFPAGKWKCQTHFCNQLNPITGPCYHVFTDISLTDLLYFKLV